MIVLSIIWIIFGLIAAGFSYAHFRHYYSILKVDERASLKDEAWGDVALGPFSLVLVLWCSMHKHGWIFPWR